MAGCGPPSDGVGVDVQHLRHVAHGQVVALLVGRHSGTMPGFLARVKSLLPTYANVGILLHMTATVTVLADRVQTVGQRTRSTIQALKGYRDLRDQDIAEAVGWSRQKVQSYVNGPTKFTAEALAAFGFVLDVPEHVLLMNRDDALRWVLDHPNGAPTPPEGGDYGLPDARRAVLLPYRARRSSPVMAGTRAA